MLTFDHEVEKEGVNDHDFEVSVKIMKSTGWLNALWAGIGQIHGCFIQLVILLTTFGEIPVDPPRLNTNV